MFFCIFNQSHPSPPLNRHPERSASQIGRVTQRLRRGVEGPRGSYPVDAARSFLAIQAREQGSPCGTHLMVTGALAIDRAMRLIQIAGNANVRRACMAAVNVDAGADGRRGETVAARWLKSSEQPWVNEAPTRSFDSAP